MTTELSGGFRYKAGVLHCEDVSLAELADEVGTPTYVYSKSALINRVKRLQSGFRETPNLDCEIYFAVKACSNIHILNLLDSIGCGADIVSSGELFRATMARVPGKNIVFSGVGKTEKEIADALKASIHMFNVESVEELKTIDRVAAENSYSPLISLRVNPDVDAKTHPYISTGLKKNKFGLSKSELSEVYKLLPSLNAAKVCGLSCHIGSQIILARPFLDAWKQLLKLAEDAPFKVEYLDLGGGLGIRYSKEKELQLEDFGRLVKKVFLRKNYKLSIEPGRSLVGPTAVLLSKMISVKKRGKKHFFVVDSAMNDLIRPALYGALHPMVPVQNPKSRKRIKGDIVGPVCESADTFATDVMLPELNAGDLVAFTNAGAYGMTMASQYNSRPRGVEVLVDGSSYKIIRKRENYADLIQHEL